VQPGRVGTATVVALLLMTTACHGGHKGAVPAPTSTATATDEPGPTQPVINLPADVDAPRMLSASGGRLWAADNRTDSHLMTVVGDQVTHVAAIGSIADAIYADASTGVVWVASTDSATGFLSSYDADTLQLLHRVTLPSRGLAITLDGPLLVGSIGQAFEVDPKSLAIEKTINGKVGGVGPFLVQSGQPPLAFVSDTAETSVHIGRLDWAGGDIVQLGALKGSVSGTLVAGDLWVASTGSGDTRTTLLHGTVSKPEVLAKVPVDVSVGASVWSGAGHLWSYEPAASEIVCRSSSDGHPLASVPAAGLHPGPGIAAGPLAEVGKYVYFSTQSNLKRVSVPPDCG
jgi:hypothetical protein